MEKCPVLKKFHNKKYQRQLLSHFTGNDEKHEKLTKRSDRGSGEKAFSCNNSGLHSRRTFWKEKCGYFNPLILLLGIYCEEIWQELQGSQKCSKVHQKMLLTELLVIPDI